jgi:hypothetical protein
MTWVVGEVVVVVALTAISAGLMIALVARMETTSSLVEQKAVAVLQSWLSAERAEQYSSYGYFEVIGSDTGKRYRIRHGRMMNIDELDSVGNRVCEWCFLPVGTLEDFSGNVREPSFSRRKSKRQRPPLGILTASPTGPWRRWPAWATVPLTVLMTN